MPDFNYRNLYVSDFADNWGPYRFEFPANSGQTTSDGLLPYGAGIQSAEVRAFVGLPKKTDSLDEFEEITGIFIDPDRGVQVSNDAIVFDVLHPGAAYRGNRIGIVFDLTLNTGAKDRFVFYCFRT
jgi:hypothetical protein